MAEDIKTKSLRILAADEDEATLRATDELLAGLGHTVIAHAVTPRRPPTSSPATTPTCRSSSCTTTTTMRWTSSRRSASTPAAR